MACSQHAHAGKAIPRASPVDGKEGLRIARISPHIIILDIPDAGDGRLVGALAVEKPPRDWPRCRSSADHAGKQDMGFALGAADYLTKPIDAAKLSP